MHVAKTILGCSGGPWNEKTFQESNVGIHQKLWKLDRIRGLPPQLL